MKKSDKPRVFSVGYQNLTQTDLKTLVEQLDVVLIDVRSVPSGRVKRGFSRRDLEALLGDRYEWRGSELGGRGSGPTVAGVQALAADPRRLMLMCMEHSPAECHRYHTIALPLLTGGGIEVHHVYEDQVIATSELEQALRHDSEYEYEELADVIAAAKK